MAPVWRTDEQRGIYRGLSGDAIAIVQNLDQALTLQDTLNLANGDASEPAPARRHLSRKFRKPSKARRGKRTNAPAPPLTSGQAQAEDRSGARALIERDVAAMGAHHLARDGEPQPGSAGTGRTGKGPEEILARLGRQARPVIGHLDQQQRLALRRAEAQAMRAGLRRVLREIDAARGRADRDRRRR